MNSDQNSIKNQGGGEPKPYKPEEGSTGNINPQNDLGNQGQQSPDMTPQQPESPNQDGGSGAMDQGGDMNQSSINTPNQPNDSGQGPANIPSPPGLDSDDTFQKNFSQNDPEDNQTPAPGPIPGDDNDSMGEPSQDGPGSVPPQDFDESDLSGNEYPPKKSNKKLFVILLIIILALGAAVAVYFLFLSPSSQEPVVNEDNEPEAVEEENNVNEEENAGNEVPAVPIVGDNEENNANEEENTEETTNEEENNVDEEENTENQQPSNIPADSHESLFSTPADTTESITIESFTVATLQSELSESPTEVPLFKEVVFQDSNNNLITFGNVVGSLAPSVFNDNLLSSFEQDATFYTYTDENGTWFGVVASLSNDADATSVQDQVASIENNTSEVSNFFLTDTGEAGSWSDGGAGGVTSRYITFGSGSASFNYGWDGNNLIIGTSYPAFQEVVEHL